MFINDIVCSIDTMNCGVQYGTEPADNVSILLYADDIVLLSGSEIKLQSMLDQLYGYCQTWGLMINYDKSKIVHFRPKSFQCTEFQFTCGDISISRVTQYKYLGLIFTEYLDFLIMTKMVAQSASRALGLLIAKDKAFGGMPFQCYTKCYDAMVQSVIDYGSSIWGTNRFSCIDSVQNRACRYFLGLGKYAPNPALQGDMGWSMPEHKQWLCVIRKWCRMINLDTSLLTRKIFMCCFEQSNLRCRTWFFRVRKFLIAINHGDICEARELVVKSVICSISAELKLLYKAQWLKKLNSDVAARGELYGGNKLRTYRKFKHSYSTEPYVCIITQKKYRSAYAKFRCGVAPIKIETCRYGLNRIPVAERLCETCNEIEDEFHVIMFCTMYSDIRDDLFQSICNINAEFFELTTERKFIYIMSNPDCYRVVSKALYNILNKRRYAEFR